jgi:hypothetical protein
MEMKCSEYMDLRHVIVTSRKASFGCVALMVDKLYWVVNLTERDYYGDRRSTGS